MKQKKLAMPAFSVLRQLKRQYLSGVSIPYNLPACLTVHGIY